MKNVTLRMHRLPLLAGSAASAAAGFLICRKIERSQSPQATGVISSSNGKVCLGDTKMYSANVLEFLDRKRDLENGNSETVFLN